MPGAERRGAAKGDNDHNGIAVTGREYRITVDVCRSPAHFLGAVVKVVGRRVEGSGWGTAVVVRRNSRRADAKSHALNGGRAGAFRDVMQVCTWANSQRAHALKASLEGVANRRRVASECCCTVRRTAVSHGAQLSACLPWPPASCPQDPPGKMYMLLACDTGTVRPSGSVTGP